MMAAASDKTAMAVALAMVGGVAIGAGAAAAYFMSEFSRAKPSVSAPATRPLPDSPELKAEQLSRNVQFFGENDQRRIEESFVVVIGVGGVGSHAAHMLARAGVGRLRLVDFDLVTLSSLNRHATATRADVGTPKVVALAQTLARIAPFVAVEAVAEMFEGSAAARLLGPSSSSAAAGPAAGRLPDVVLDCIDDKETKAQLLAYCKAHNLRVLSSLGAAGKSDPTRVHIADLSLVRRDPLGTALRYQLRKLGLLPRGTDEGRELLKGGKKKDKGGAGAGAGAATDDKEEKEEKEEEGTGKVALSGIPCVYSSELPRVRMLPLPMDTAKGETPADFGAVPGFRVRVIPVLGAMPAMFGQVMAAWTLCTLGGPAHALEPTAAPAMSYNAAFKLQSRYSQWETNMYKKHGGVLGVSGGISLDEVCFVVEESWKQRSPISNVRIGTRAVNMQLCRWRPWAGSVPSNLVLLVDEEAAALTAATLSPEFLALAAAVAEAAGTAAAQPKNAAAAQQLAAARAALESRFRTAAAGVVGGEEAVAAIQARLAWTAAQGWS